MAKTYPKITKPFSITDPKGIQVNVLLSTTAPETLELSIGRNYVDGAKLDRPSVAALIEALRDWYAGAPTTTEAFCVR